MTICVLTQRHNFGNTARTDSGKNNAKTAECKVDEQDIHRISRNPLRIFIHYKWKRVPFAQEAGRTDATFPKWPSPHVTNKGTHGHSVPPAGTPRLCTLLKSLLPKPFNLNLIMVGGGYSIRQMAWAISKFIHVLKDKKWQGDRGRLLN